MQNIWNRYDDRIAENNRLNREVLKSILNTKLETWVSRVKKDLVFNLIFSLAAMIFMCGRLVKYSDNTMFYVTAAVAIGFVIVAVYWKIKYYVMADRIDPAGPVVKMREDIDRIRMFSLRTLNMGYILSPLFGFSILYLVGFNFLTANAAVFFGVVIIMAVVAIILRKRNIAMEFQKLRRELDELEELQKE